MSVNTGPQETPAVTVGNFAKTLSLFVWGGHEFIHTSILSVEASANAK